MQHNLATCSWVCDERGPVSEFGVSAQASEGGVSGRGQRERSERGVRGRGQREGSERGVRGSSQREGLEGGVRGRGWREVRATQ